MEIEELLARLDQHRGSFPGDFVAEATARREEITPALLAILEAAARDPEPFVSDQSRMVHIFAMYLLASFRETRAYSLLVKIFSEPGEAPFELAGDAITMSLGAMLAGVCGGDVSGMTELIENEQANEYVRSAALDGLLTLVACGERERDVVVAYFLGLFRQFERIPNHFWDSLAAACAALYPEETIRELRSAYEEELIDETFFDWEGVEEALAAGKSATLTELTRTHLLITDLRNEMGWMECFQNKEAAMDRPKALTLSEFCPAPIHRPGPKVGRNDPCPCGSGKKFKKCCADS